MSLCHGLTDAAFVKHAKGSKEEWCWYTTNGIGHVNISNKLKTYLKRFLELRHISIQRTKMSNRCLVHFFSPLFLKTLKHRQVLVSRLSFIVWIMGYTVIQIQQYFLSSSDMAWSIRNSRQIFVTSVTIMSWQKLNQTNSRFINLNIN